MAAEMKIRDMQDSDREAVMRIFNHYAVTSFAAYPDGPLPLPFFEHLREGSLSAVVLDREESVYGFGFLKSFLPFPAFRRTGMLTYFVAPDSVGQGFGTLLLGRLTEDARNAGMKVLVANMSSGNKASIRFHKHHGFSEAGILTGVGEKFGESFDILWMQKAVE